MRTLEVEEGPMIWKGEPANLVGVLAVCTIWAFLPALASNCPFGYSVVNIILNLVTSIMNIAWNCCAVSSNLRS